MSGRGKMAGGCIGLFAGVRPPWWLSGGGLIWDYVSDAAGWITIGVGLWFRKIVMCKELTLGKIRIAAPIFFSFSFVSTEVTLVETEIGCVEP